MEAKGTVQRLYTEKASLYQRLFIDFLGWGRELEAFFRRSDYLRPNVKILDAGCGTGVVTRILYKLAQEKRQPQINFNAFDLTPSMLKIFQQWVTEQKASNVELRQADVLKTENLPSSWKDYDLIISSTMLEYLPKSKVTIALRNLKERLKSKGVLLVFMTRRNSLTWWLAGKWWKANIYSENQAQKLFYDAGFKTIAFKVFSSNLWWSRSIMVIEARNF